MGKDKRARADGVGGGDGQWHQSPSQEYLPSPSPDPALGWIQGGASQQPEARAYKGQTLGHLAEHMLLGCPEDLPQVSVAWNKAGPSCPPHPAGKQGPEQDMLILQPVGTPPQALRATESPSGELPYRGSQKAEQPLPPVPAPTLKIPVAGVLLQCARG